LRANTEPYDNLQVQFKHLYKTNRLHRLNNNYYKLQSKQRKVEALQYIATARVMGNF